MVEDQRPIAASEHDSARIHRAGRHRGVAFRRADIEEGRRVRRIADDDGAAAAVHAQHARIRQGDGAIGGIAGGLARDTQASRNRPERIFAGDGGIAARAAGPADISREAAVDGAAVFDGEIAGGVVVAEHEDVGGRERTGARDGHAAGSAVCAEVEAAAGGEAAAIVDGYSAGVAGAVADPRPVLAERGLRDDRLDGAGDIGVVARVGGHAVGPVRRIVPVGIGGAGPRGVGTRGRDGGGRERGGDKKGGDTGAGKELAAASPVDEPGRRGGLAVRLPSAEEGDGEGTPSQM